MPTPLVKGAGIPVWMVPEDGPEVAKKDQGIARAEAGNTEQVELARSLARRIGATGQGVTTDAIRRLADQEGIKLEWGKWAGAIFKTDEWEDTGQMVRAEYDGSHARRLIVWRLRGAR